MKVIKQKGSRKGATNKKPTSFHQIINRYAIITVLISSMAFIPNKSNAQAPSFPSIQQGNKLVGTGYIGYTYQGVSVSVSSDGNTAIVGGYYDNNFAGAAWVFTRTGGVWTQQGSKLVGTGAIGSAKQGVSVSLSADGNTAIVGGYADNSEVGAAWIFTRTAGVWTQQGSKLVGTGAIGAADQGFSVSLSSDGNTAIVGGDYDNSLAGAAWVYTRSGGVWSQQGSKLVGTGAVGQAEQGQSVSLSSDGNTAIVGGGFDNNYAGAAWIFSRSNGVWAQQGSKLVGTGAVGSSAYQGASVSISSDGNTAILGGFGDDSAAGAAWIFIRSGGVWNQQGNKLVGTGATGAANQGCSVSISSAGNTAIVGGWYDNNYAGATWVYTRIGGVWSQQGSKLVGIGASSPTGQGFSVSVSSDGSIAIVGAWVDNSNTGASWIFVSSATSGIDNIIRNNNQITVFPNPNNGVFNIQSTKEGTYSIMNSLGQTVRSFKLNAINNYSLNIENLSNGIYYIVGYNKNEMSRQKFVVTK